MDFFFPAGNVSPLGNVNVPSVAIIGAGPVGILSAIGLSQLGCRVQLIEKRSNTMLLKRADQTKISRLYAISLGSYEIMRDVIGVNFDTKNFQSINKILINDGVAKTNFKPEEISERNFGYMVEESDLFGQLLDRLDYQDDGMKTYFGISNLEIVENESTEVTKKKNPAISLKIDGKPLSADIILATDGRSSVFRRTLPFGERKKDYKELGLVFNMKHSSFKHQGVAVETFFPTGPFAVLPHSEQTCSSVVWSANKDMVEKFVSLPIEEKKSIIRKKLPDFYGDFDFTSDFITYPLGFLKLDNLYHKNVLLLGDSSHVVHPVAGQGFNLGVRDVRDMLNVVSHYNFYTDIEHMFGEYQKLRQQDISKLANSTDFLSCLFSNNNALLKAMRRLGLDLFDSLPKSEQGLRKKIIKYAAGKVDF